MRPADRSDHVGLLAIGAAALAVACCAGLPLLAGTATAIGAVAVLGIGAGSIVVIVAVAAVLGSARRRRRRGRLDSEPERPAQ